MSLVKTNEEIPSSMGEVTVSLDAITLSLSSGDPLYYRHEEEEEEEEEENSKQRSLERSITLPVDPKVQKRLIFASLIAAMYKRREVSGSEDSDLVFNNPRSIGSQPQQRDPERSLHHPQQFEPEWVHHHPDPQEYEREFSDSQCECHRRQYEHEYRKCHPQHYQCYPQQSEPERSQHYPPEYSFNYYPQHYQCYPQQNGPEGSQQYPQEYSLDYWPQQSQHHPQPYEPERSQHYPPEYSFNYCPQPYQGYPQPYQGYPQQNGPEGSQQYPQEYSLNCWPQQSQHHPQQCEPEGCQNYAQEYSLNCWLQQSQHHPQQCEHEGCQNYAQEDSLNYCPEQDQHHRQLFEPEESQSEHNRDELNTWEDQRYELVPLKSILGEEATRHEDFLEYEEKHKYFGVLQRKNSSRVAPKWVVAIRGTKITEWHDIQNDLRVMFERLHNSPTAKLVKIVVSWLVKHIDPGGKNVVITGHSLGAAIGMEVARELALDPKDKCVIESHFFNPPFATPGALLLQTLRLPRLVVGGMWDMVGGRFWERCMQKVCVDASKICNNLLDGGTRMKQQMEEYNALLNWRPNLYINENDFICRLYCQDSEEQKDDQMYRWYNPLSALINAVIPGSKTFHLMPRAIYIISRTKRIRPLSAHRLKNWLDPRHNPPIEVREKVTTVDADGKMRMFMKIISGGTKQKGR